MSKDPFEFEAFKQVNAIVEDRERREKQECIGCKPVEVRKATLNYILNALLLEQQRTGPEPHLETEKAINLVQRLLKR